MSTTASMPTTGKTEPRFNLLTLLIGGLGILIGAVLTTGIGVGVGVRGDDIPMLMWTVATFAVCAIPVVIDSAREKGARHIALSIVCIGFALRFGLPILTYYIPAIGPIDSPDLPLSNLMPGDIAYAQALLLMGFVVLLLAYSLPIGTRVASLFPKPKHDWAPAAGVLAALGLVLFGWVFFFATQFGLLPSSLGSGVIGAFSEAALFGPAILAATYLRGGRAGAIAMLLILIVVPITSGLNFFTGYKRLVLTPPAIVALTWIVFRRQIQMRWAIAGFVALLMLYPSAQFYREIILDNNTRTLADVVANPSPAIASLGRFFETSRGLDYITDGLEATGSRLDGVGHAAVIIRDTPSLVPYQGGWTIGLVPLTYIPRVIWPEKPVITIGSWIIDNYRVVGEEIESSIGPTWVGEFYLNFGFWGIPPGMFFLGILLRFVHESLVTRSVTTLTLALETIVIYQLFLKLTGSLPDLINGPVLAAIPIAGVHLLMRATGNTTPLRPLIEPEEESPSDALI